jgi:hypothetical protein
MARVPVYNLEWKTPPSADQEIIDTILAQLQNNPGEWARICKDRSTTNLVSDWLKMGCEAKHVRANPGTSPARYDVYARWPKDKPATLPNTLRAEVAKTTASKTPPSAIREAVATGHALTPAPRTPPVPRTGNYLADRAARGINPEGIQP